MGAAKRGDEGRAETTAGAWAAAAVVLALGALGFGVASQFQVQDLSARVDRLERQARVASTIPVAAVGTGVDATSVSPPEGVPGSTESTPPAQTAAVETAFERLYDGSTPIGQRVSLIDDPSGIVEAFGALDPTVARQMATLRAQVHRVTFTSTSTATVSYSVQTAGGEPVQRLGGARLVDGIWKVARSTVCADLEAAGARCAS